MGKLVRIKVFPDSRKDQILEGSPLIVRVKAPAQRGEANKAVMSLLSSYFGARVRIVTGGKTPNKTVEVG